VTTGGWATDHSYLITVHQALNQKEMGMSDFSPRKPQVPCSSVREDHFFEFVAGATDEELLLFLEQGSPLIRAMASDRSIDKDNTLEVRKSKVVELTSTIRISRGQRRFKS
jgi:hypothetical protein